MKLIEYEQKNVVLTDIDNKEFRGFVSDYVYAEDNEPEEESIIIETSEGKSIEFKTSEIKEIKEIKEL